MSNTDPTLSAGNGAERGNYNDVLLGEAELGFPLPFDPSARIQILVDHQRQFCEKIRDGHAGLAELETNPIKLEGGSTVVLQLNPSRADRPKSAAKDDICFLDANRLLPGQKSVPYEDNEGTITQVLANPFPILPNHITVPIREHSPQRLQPLLTPALHLARDRQDFLVFYNGPEVGATAPGHAHLQAGSRVNLPIQADFLQAKGEPVMGLMGMQIYLPEHPGRTVVVVEGDDEDVVSNGLLAIMDRLPREGDAEPLVNIIFTYNRDHWTVYLFPRSQFQPACATLDDGDPRYRQLGPASLEMAGIMVTSRTKDFEEITSDEVAQCYQDVSLDRAYVESLLKARH